MIGAVEGPEAARGRERGDGHGDAGGERGAPRAAEHRDPHQHRVHDVRHVQRRRGQCPRLRRNTAASISDNTAKAEYVATRPPRALLESATPWKPIVSSSGRDDERAEEVADPPALHARARRPAWPKIRSPRSTDRDERAHQRRQQRRDREDQHVAQAREGNGAAHADMHQPRAEQRRRELHGNSRPAAEYGSCGANSVFASISAT